MNIEYIPKSSARRIPLTKEFTILEYGSLGDGVANGTVAEVNGRYPLSGWGMNRDVDEIVYVVSGSGAIEMPEGEQKIAQGDVALVKKGQKIAWRGENLVVFIPCVPAWHHGQHELFDEITS